MADDTIMSYQTKKNRQISSTAEISDVDQYYLKKYTNVIRGRTALLKCITFSNELCKVNESKLDQTTNLQNFEMFLKYYELKLLQTNCLSIHRNSVQLLSCTPLSNENNAVVHSNKTTYKCLQDLPIAFTHLTYILATTISQTRELEEELMHTKQKYMALQDQYYLKIKLNQVSRKKVPLSSEEKKMKNSLITSILKKSEIVNSLAFMYSGNYFEDHDLWKMIRMVDNISHKIRMNYSASLH